MIDKIVMLFEGYTFIDWVTLIGSLVGLVVGFLKIFEYIKNRPSLIICIKQETFICNKGNSMIASLTKVGIQADIWNKGKVPCTITEVKFYSDYEEFSEMTLYGKNAEAIRIDAPDRKKHSFYGAKEVALPEEVKELNAKLVFITSDKPVVKKIILKRE